MIPACLSPYERRGGSRFACVQEFVEKALVSNMKALQDQILHDLLREHPPRWIDTTGALSKIIRVGTHARVHRPPRTPAQAAAARRTCRTRTSRNALSTSSFFTTAAGGARPWRRRR